MIVESIEREYGIKIELDSILRELALEDKIEADDELLVGPPEAEGEPLENVPALEDSPERYIEPETPQEPIYMPPEPQVEPISMELSPIEAYVPEERPSLLDIAPEEKMMVNEDLDYTQVKIVFEKVGIDKIMDIADKKKKRRLFGPKENLVCNYLVYYPLWQVTYDYFPRRKKYASLATFIDGITGEIVLKHRKGSRTRGMRELLSLKREERDFLLYLIDRENATYPDIEKDLDIREKKARGYVDKLLSQRLVKTVKRGEHLEIHPNFDFELVDSPVNKKVSAVELEYGEEYIEKGSLIDFVVSDSEASKVIEFFEHIQIWNMEKVYYLLGGRIRGWEEQEDRGL